MKMKLRNGRAEALRVLKPGGVFGATVFAASQANKSFIPDLRAAFKTLPFDAPFPDPFLVRFNTQGDWLDAGWIQSYLPTVGFEDAKAELFPYEMKIHGVDAFMNRFAMMADFVVNRYWSDEMKAEHGESVRPAIRKYLEDTYRNETHSLWADAIIVTGKKPA